ncbi:MAG: amidohydrolase family protein [Opitutales bacterium]
MNKRHLISRRGFLASASPAIAIAMQAQTPGKEKETTIDEPVIDVHQHTNYLFRSDKRLVAHQRAMGVTTTLLLPAGSTVNRPSTHEGKSNGLAAKTGGNETVMALAKKHPTDFRFGVNEVPDLPNARKELEKYLKAGAVIIGEQKFNVACDSPHIWGVAEVAREYGVPVLMHFQHNAYNLGIERFHRTLEKFPEVNFIGHAQTWWGNVDKNHKQAIMYPKTKVNPGGDQRQTSLQLPEYVWRLFCGIGSKLYASRRGTCQGFHCSSSQSTPIRKRLSRCRRSRCGLQRFGHPRHHSTPRPRQESRT